MSFVVVFISIISAGFMDTIFLLLNDFFDCIYVCAKAGDKEMDLFPGKFRPKLRGYWPCDGVGKASP